MSVEQENQLRQHLRKCTYPEEKKIVIEMKVLQALRSYPAFEIDFITFQDEYGPGCFLELKGFLEILANNQRKYVEFNLMLPRFFPQHPPYSRIINYDPNTKINPFYIAYQSKTDPKSFIMNGLLHQRNNWMEHKQIERLMIGASRMMSQIFPFTLVEKQRPYYANTEATARPQKPNYESEEQGVLALTKVADAQVFAGKSKKMLEKLQAQHRQILNPIQELDLLNRSLQSEQTHLDKTNLEIVSFLSEHENQWQISLGDMVQPANRKSEQMINLIANIRAREQCLMLLDFKFGNEQLKLEQFLKKIHKITGDLFLEKYILNKCQA